MNSSSLKRFYQLELLKTGFPYVYLVEKVLQKEWKLITCQIKIHGWIYQIYCELTVLVILHYKFLYFVNICIVLLFVIIDIK